MSNMKTIRVKFDSVDIDGLTIASQNRASSTLYIGDMVLAIESPGYSCIASVAAVEPNGIVKLVLDPASWRDAPAVA